MLTFLAALNWTNSTSLDTSAALTKALRASRTGMEPNARSSMNLMSSSTSLSLKMSDANGLLLRGTPLLLVLLVLLVLGLLLFGLAAVLLLAATGAAGGNLRDLGDDDDDGDDDDVLVRARALDHSCFKPRSRAT